MADATYLLIIATLLGLACFCQLLELALYRRPRSPRRTAPVRIHRCAICLHIGGDVGPLRWDEAAEYCNVCKPFAEEAHVLFLHLYHRGEGASW